LSLREDWLAWLAFGLGTALAGALSAPALAWLDSAEFVGAARELGLVHPPGHPVWLSLAGLCELVPLGPHALRVAWLSAACAGLSLLLVVRLARGLGLGSAWAAVAATGLAASGSWWQVAVRPEVYTLALVGNLWALEAALRARRQPAQSLGPLAEVTAAVCVGLGNHHYVTLFALPAVVLAAWPALRALAGPRALAGDPDRRRWLLWLAVGAAVLGLVYLALPLRARADIELRWGHPATLAGFWDTVTAKQFHRSVTESRPAIGNNLLILLGMVAGQMGWWLPLTGVAGLIWGLRRQPLPMAALGLAVLGALATKALMWVDVHNPDDHGYVLLASAVLAVAGAWTLAQVTPWAQLAVRLPSRWQVLVPALAGLGLLAWLVPTALERRLDRLRAPEVVDSELRRRLPPGAVWLANYYGLAFSEQAFRLAEGRRPDLAAVHLSMRTGDTDGGHGWQRWFARRRPELAELARGAEVLGRPPVGNLLALAERQPVYAEQDPEARIPPTYLQPTGIASRLLPAVDRSIAYDVAAVRRGQAEAWQRLDDRLGSDDRSDGPTRGLLLWQSALTAAHDLRRGWFLAAADELERARKLSPRDSLLAVLDLRTRTLADAWHRGDTAGFRTLWQRYQTLDFDQMTTAD
jgi:hypothetical protein